MYRKRARSTEGALEGKVEGKNDPEKVTKKKVRWSKEVGKEDKGEQARSLTDPEEVYRKNRKLQSVTAVTPKSSRQRNFYVMGIHRQKDKEATEAGHIASSNEGILVKT